jgi:hypothetical protein
MTARPILGPAAFLALLAGCMTPTWQRHAPGAPIGRDTVILVGSISADPPFNQDTPVARTWQLQPTPNVPSSFVGGQAGNVMAYFTDDVSEPLRQSVNRMPFDRFDWAWLPMQGYFFVEVPRRERVLLRGMQYYTRGDDGAVRFELPAQVDLRDDDRVVYVGEIRVVGGPQRRFSFNDRAAEARKVAEAAGYGDVLALPWRTRLLRSIDADAARSRAR